ncbi:MAG: hypothetical protein WC942_08780 [Clostridia bacterium]|jgi:hypothetical protein
MTITKEEKQGLRKYYEINIVSVKEELDSLQRKLEITKFKLSLAKDKKEKNLFYNEILMINDRVSRLLGQLDILNSMRFCSV